MKDKRHNFTIETAGYTHVGRQRQHNEDAYLINPDLSLYIVADGMGGHNSGEIASKLATETINNFFTATNEDDEITWPYRYDMALSMAENRFNVSIRLANDRIWRTSRKNALYEGMGTTAVCVHFEGESAFLAHVGDSRAYLLRQNRLTQLTEDHSLLNDLRKKRTMTKEEIAAFPHKNVIMRALGIREKVQVDIFRHQPQAQDMMLLCSDGLSDMVDDAAIEAALLESRDLHQTAKELIRLANDAGGKDNITLILLRVG